MLQISNYILCILSVQTTLFATDTFATMSILKSLTKQQTQLELSRKNNIIIIMAIIIAILIATLAAIISILIWSKKYKNKNKNQATKESKVKNDAQHNEKKQYNNLEHLMELAKSDDSAFLSTFRDTYPQFYNKLISLHDGLSNTDIKLCAMIYLNISTKDIAKYTSVGIRTVQTRRNRFRKKINLDPKMDLFIFLHTL